VKVDAGGNQDDKDRSGYPVDDEAERRPPAGVGNIVAVLLPEVFESVGGEADYQQPRRSGDADRREHHKHPRDAALDGDDGRPAVGHREADVDRRDQGQRERVASGRIQPLEAKRRRGLHAAEDDSPQDRRTQQLLSIGHVVAACLWLYRCVNLLLLGSVEHWTVPRTGERFNDGDGKRRG